MRTNFNKDNRSVESILDTAEGIQVSITTSHNKEGKYYHTSIYRQRVQDGIVRFALREDHYGSEAVLTPRYSAKAIQETHEKFLDSVVVGSEAAFREWAREIKTEAV